MSQEMSSSGDEFHEDSMAENVPLRRSRNLFGGLLGRMNDASVKWGEMMLYLWKLDFNFCGLFRVKFWILAILMLLPTVIFGYDDWTQWLWGLVWVTGLLIICILLKRREEWAANQNSAESGAVLPTTVPSNSNSFPPNPSQSTYGQNAQDAPRPPPQRPTRATGVHTIADLP